MERVPGGYIGAIPTQNAASRPGVASMEQTLDAMEREGAVPFPGSDALADYVTLSLEVDDVNKKIVDQSGRNHTVQAWNNCIVTESDRRPNSSSMFFNGNSSFIEVPSSYDLHVGSSDFTLECWFNILTQKEQAIVSKEQVSTGTSGVLLYLHTDSTLRFLAGNGSSWFVSMATSFAPLPGVWYHVAVSRNDQTWVMYANGQIIGAAFSVSGVWYGQTSRPLQIGRYGPWNDATKDFHGYIDKIRLTERITRYSPNFNVATSELPTNTSGDQYFNNVSALLLMNGTNGSTTFTDSSSNSVTVTAYGNAQISTAQSKFGGASALFDGSGDGLTIPSSSNFDFGSGDFTIEFWARATTLSGQDRSLATKGWVSGGVGAWLVYYDNTNNRYAFYASSNGTSWDIASAVVVLSAPQTNRWYHIAVMRQGIRFTIFVDGIMRNSFTSSASLVVNSSHKIGIGADANGTGNGFAGYIDDFRITKGVARYSSDFTPPSRPAGFIPTKTGDPYFMDVGLLLRAEGSDGSRVFTDSSRRNLAITPVGGLNTITANGNAQISTAQSKFGGASAAFDGAGDYLTVSSSLARLSSGDHTVEFWFYVSTLPTSGNEYFLWAQYYASGAPSGRCFTKVNSTGTVTAQLGSSSVTSAATVATGTWNHIAYTRSGTANYLFLNGTMEGSFSSSQLILDTEISLGALNANTGASPSYNQAFFNGYIDDLRITKGVARYTANFTPPTTANPANINDDPFYLNTSLLMSMNGTNGSTVFTDSSITGSAVSTITSKVGTASAFFKGDGYLSIPDSDAFNFAASDFTIETWVRPTGNSGNNAGTFSSCIAASDVSGSRGWALFLGGTPSAMDRLNFEGYTNNTTVTAIFAPYNFFFNTWYHIAVVRSQNRLFMFVNGKLLNKDGTSFSITIQDSSSALKIGAHDFDSTYKYYMNGFIDELRITKNVARYISDFTPSTSPLPELYKATGADLYGKYTTFLLRAEGSNGYTLIRDSSYIDNPITVNGNAAISTTDKKFGNSSLYFDGTGDYLSVPNDVFRFEREDFTIEFWIKLETNTATYPYLISSSAWNANGGFTIVVYGPATGWGGTGRINFNGSNSGAGGPSMLSTTDIRNNTWHHIAITRSGALHTLWVNGTAEATSSNATANYTGNTGLIFSDALNLTGGNEKGYLDEMRITRGLARYTTTFTPPTAAFPDP